MTCVYLKLPYGLTTLAGARETWCEGETVGEVFASLFELDPSLRSRVYRPDGSLRVTVILNGREVEEAELGLTLASGDHLSLLPSHGGGHGRGAECG